MIKNFLFILILIFCSNSCWSQIKISGKVIDNTNYPLPGVTVKEIGSQNSTQTDFDGLYSIIVKDSNSVISFSYLGYLEKKIIVNKQTEINPILKEYVLYHTWDQKIGFNINSGLINNSFGGQLDFSIPIFKSSIGLKSSIGYQTDFIKNTYLNAKIGLHHVRIGYRGYGANFATYYSLITTEKNYTINTYSIESRWPIYQFSLIIGYGYIKSINDYLSESTSESGIIFGVQKWISDPLDLSVSGKIGFYKKMIEVQTVIRKSFGRRINTFIKYRNIANFSELSIGIGLEFTYLFKYQKKFNTYD